MTRPTDIRSRFPQASADFLARNNLTTTATTTPVKSKTTTTDIAAHDPHDVTPQTHTLSFFVAGNPVGQPRIRAAVRKGCKHAVVYDPGTADAWKALVVAAVKKHKPASMMLGPVRLRLSFLMRRPKLHYQPNGQLKSVAPWRHTNKPDADNLTKAVMDAITTTGAIWHDDAQIAELVVIKSYCNGVSKETGVHITVNAEELQEVLP